MKYRKFGETDLDVSEISFGCNKLGKSVLNSNQQKDSIKIIHKAIELGINLFDLAPTYSYGDAEIIVGAALKEKRKSLYIVTKCGRMPSSLAKYGKTARHFTHVISPILSPFRSNLKKASKSRFDFSPSQMESSLIASLERLGTDYIDLLLLHNPSIEVIKNGEVFEWLEKMKSDGIIRYYGASIDTLTEAKEALKYPIDALQVTYNIIQNSMAEQLLAHINNPGIMIKTPLLRGLLSSKKDIKSEYFEKEKIKLILDKKGKLDFLSTNRTWNHIALNYLLLQDKVSTVICGTTSITHLKENLNFHNMKPFSVADQKQIREIQNTFSL